MEIYTSLTAFNPGSDFTYIFVWNPVVIILCVYLLLLTAKSVFGEKELPLPPGPARIPLLGNLHQVPGRYPWLTYQKWHKLYGPIISLKYGQRTVIVLGSHQVVADILKNRSRNYSSRPHMIVAGDSITRNHAVGLMQYGERWRIHRRIMNTFLSTQIMKQYQLIQSIKSKQLLHELLSSNDFAGGFKRYTSRNAFALAYGKDLLSEHEPAVRDSDEILHITTMTLLKIPNLIVEVFPFLDHLPRKLTPWRRMGDKVYAKAVELFTEHLDQAQQSKSWNWVKAAMETSEAQRMPRDELAYMFGHIHEASAGTLTASMETFVLASVLHPDATGRVQKELDTIVGRERLPTFEDMPKLPYLAAFVKEVLRWRPTIPAGGPHCALEADEYMGFRIPKGAIVLPNHWSLEFDEETFEAPTEFRPERWIENPRLPLSAFGFGLRTCPGEVIAQQSLLIVISRILWAFDVLMDSSVPKAPLFEPTLMSPEFISRPKPFEVSFTVRSPAQYQVVEKEWAESEKDVDGVLESIKHGIAR